MMIVHFINRKEGLNMEYGLIGEKLGHSFSQIIHEQLANYTYDLCPLSKEEFVNFMKQKAFRAINVTIPYKIDVIPYLTEIDIHAQEIGAVNTIVNRNGELYGYNTDFFGFLYMVQQHDIEIKNKKVLVLGKGGASKAILAVLKHLQAKEVITVYYKESPNTISYEEAKKYHWDAEIIVNTTPVGMYPHFSETPLDLTPYIKCEAVLDVIYNPLKPLLLVEAEEKGIKIVSGLEMLIAQAKFAVEIFLGQDIPKQTIDIIYQKMVEERTNIVLIGMPSCGKTTLGKEMAEKWKKEFVDMDDLIVEKIGMSIADYFVVQGEDAFRRVETEVARELARRNGLVISTGGGCVKNKENMDYLKMNGVVFFIDREVKYLVADPSRPLSKSPEVIEKLYEQREPLYQIYSEVRVENNGSLDETKEKLQKAYWNRFYG